MPTLAVLPVYQRLNNLNGFLLLSVIIGILFLSLVAIYEAVSKARRAENRCLHLPEGIALHHDKHKPNDFQRKCYFFTGDKKFSYRTLDVPSHFSKDEPIPRILHRTWKGEDPTPEEWIVEAPECSRKDFGFYICDWGDSDMDKFIASEYPSFLPTYLSYRYPTQRLDVARYFIVNHFGGLYLDLDHDRNFPLSKFLDNSSSFDVILAEKNSPAAGLVNSFILSRPRQAFWNHVTDNLPNSNVWYGLAYDTVTHSTGRMHLTKCLSTYSNSLSRSNASRIATIPVNTITGIISQSMARSPWRSWKRRAWNQCYRCRYVLGILICFIVLLFRNCILAKHK